MTPAKKAAAKKTAAKKRTTAKKAAEDEVLAEQIANSTPAGEDLEEMITEYEQLVEDYREPQEHKEEREELKERITAILAQDGPRYYAGPGGSKRLAWQTTPERVEADVEALMRLDEDGDIPPDLLDLIAPRTLDRSGLRKAISTGAITPEQVRAVVTITEMTPRLYTRTIETDGGA